MHGVGTCYYKDGSEYKGEWRNDKRDGRGEMHYANGDTYVGEWVGGMRHGKGELTMINGNVYNGGWYKDKKEGEGSYFYKSAMQKFIGEWRCDTAKVNTFFFT